MVVSRFSCAAGKWGLVEQSSYSLQRGAGFILVEEELRIAIA